MVRATGGDPGRLPVIVGVGEVADRPGNLAEAREPAALMAESLRRAEADAGTAVLRHVARLDVVREVSWPYEHAGRHVLARAGLGPAHIVDHPIGGQTPMLALHEAALSILEGEVDVAALCGAEAQASVDAARRHGVALPWTPRWDGAEMPRGGDGQSAAMRALDLAVPSHVYPLYENACRAAWRQGFAEAQAESARIWADNAAVARGREASWIKRIVQPEEVATPSSDNRRIAWPYTKLMVANPGVNQGAAVVLCSAGRAAALGIDARRLVYVWGGAAADEPRDVLSRDAYHRSAAMDAVLARAARICGGAPDLVELYSCFPCVPKMARRTLGLASDVPTSVAGGLTFFGAPLNNYMTHAVVAAVQRLRVGAEAAKGLLYGQGEYVTKHHAVVLGRRPPRSNAATTLGRDYRDEALERSLAAAAPAVHIGYAGPAHLETFTVLFERSGAVRHGAVIARTPDGKRFVARVSSADEASLRCLVSEFGDGPVGKPGWSSMAADGLPEWRFA